jgi:hypothetical protein
VFLRPELTSADPRKRFANDFFLSVKFTVKLELHLREDYRLSPDSRERQRLACFILNEIERRARVPEK